MLDIMINFLDFYPQYFIYCRQTLYESIHGNTCFFLYVKNSGTDQTAHLCSLIGAIVFMCSLIGAIVFHWQNCIIYVLAKANIL